jgi:deoxyhypusine synthase
LLINYPRANSTFSGFADATNYRNEQKRISMLKAAEANKIQIVVPGRCDYTVGQKVKVNLYKIEPLSKDDTDNLDKMLSGNYLIAAVNHRITRERHECNMELIKDSLMMKVN